MKNRYDVIIIGGGVIGAAIGYTLSKYKIHTLIVEKNIDVAFGVSKANSGIIHPGFHHKLDTLKSKLEVWGNLLYTKLHKELKFPFKRNGAVVVAFNDDEMKIIEQLYENGIKNEVPGIEFCNRERILKLEPYINKDVIGGIYAPTAGIIEPYKFVFSLIEFSLENGVDLKREFKVTNVDKNSDNSYTLYSDNGDKVTGRYIINAAGLYADEVSKIFNAEKFHIRPRKGEEFVLDKEFSSYINHTIYPVPGKISKGVLIIPTVEGTVMVGPTADFVESKEDTTTDKENLRKVFNSARRLIPSVSEKYIITSFAGLRPVKEDSEDFYIKISEKIENFIQVAGIQSPGLTAAPAIGEYVKELLLKLGIKLEEKLEFKNDDKANMFEVRHLEYDQIEDVWSNNHKYGNIICRCEMVSEAEIIEAIKRGHTTLDGIKFYTRAGMGRCQGGFCGSRILKLIEKYAHIKFTEITKKGKGSEIVKGKIGEKLNDQKR